MTSSKSIKVLRYLALVSYVLLLIFVTSWHTWLAPSEMHSVAFQLLLYVVPLLFPLIGILRGRAYTHAWANFILMWYFLHSLTVLYTHPEARWLAAIELILAIGAFIGCTYYARAQGRAQGLGLKKLKDEPEGR